MVATASRLIDYTRTETKGDAQDREPQIMQLRGVFQGTINGDRMYADILMQKVPSLGTLQVLVDFTDLPRHFPPQASSGTSSACNENGSNALPLHGALSLTSLHGGKYELFRRNEFPDGSAIEMHFDTDYSREVAIQAEWNGTYTLPIDIVKMEMPVIEELESVEPGIVNSFYRYAIWTSKGERFVVNTPSTYRFTPHPDRPAVLPFKQRRLGMFASYMDFPKKKWWVEVTSLMVPAEKVPSVYLPQ